MEKKRIYISGMIAHLPLDERRKAFKMAADYWSLKGLDVVNPFENGLSQEADCQWDGSCVEVIGGGSFDDIPGDLWVFGFDTMHYNDGPEHDREWCIRETRQLRFRERGFYLLNEDPARHAPIPAGFGNVERAEKSKE